MEREASHEEERDPALAPRIWVGSLSDYNNGILHGEWIDAAQEPDNLDRDIQSMLARSPSLEPAEEWGIFDHEDFAGVRPHQYESLDVISRLALGLVEHGPAFGAWADSADSDRVSIQRFSDAFLGEWASATEYVEEQFDSLGCLTVLEQAVPADLRPYVRFDAEALANDLQLNGDITVCFTAEGRVWIFDAHV